MPSILRVGFRVPSRGRDRSQRGSRGAFAIEAAAEQKSRFLRTLFRRRYSPWARSGSIFRPPPSTVFRCVLPSETAAPLRRSCLPFSIDLRQRPLASRIHDLRGAVPQAASAQVAGLPIVAGTVPQPEDISAGEDRSGPGGAAQGTGDASGRIHFARARVRFQNAGGRWDKFPIRNAQMGPPFRSHGNGAPTISHSLRGLRPETRAPPPSGGDSLIFSRPSRERPGRRARQRRRGIRRDRR